MSEEPHQRLISVSHVHVHTPYPPTLESYCKIKDPDLTDRKLSEVAQRRPNHFTEITGNVGMGVWDDAADLHFSTRTGMS